MTVAFAVVAALVKIAFVLAVVVAGIVPVLTWMERRQSAMIQDRIGPNRADLLLFGRRFRFWGLLHPVADAIKMLRKEDFVPAGAHVGLFTIAPVFAMAAPLIVFAVIPFGPTLCWGSLGIVDPGGAECSRPVRLQIAHLDAGLLFVFAIASLSVYGYTLAGWASYNKWALLGGLRASAQMISYEVTMGLAVVGALLVYGTLEPGAMVEAQRGGLLQWGIVRQPLGFVLFTVAALAETKRAPFDMPEGESEIIGYFVEYGGMRFAMFMAGEFIEVVGAAAMITTVFLGGHYLPFGIDEALRALPHWTYVMAGVAVWIGKVMILCTLQLAVRWTLPRFRYDQLMRLGWKGLLPASLCNVAATAVIHAWR
jgi:NADH-quinone oxidoreductase subunit H